MVEVLDIHQEDEESSRMTIWEHLEELRKRLIFCVITLLIGFCVCWLYRDAIFEVIQAPFLKYVAKGDKLSFISLTEPFMVYMKVAGLAAIIFTSPILVTQIWLFISPGLYKKERRYAIPFIFFSTFFFLSGCLFCYKYVFPFACSYFLEVGAQFKQQVRVDDYFSLFSKLTLSIGLIFETPILAFFLARFGIIDHRMLISYMKYAVLASFIISAIITPTPDMVNQTILAVSMLALYLVSILIALIFGKKKNE